MSKKLIINGEEVKPGKKLRLSDLGKRISDVIPETKERVKTTPKYKLPVDKG